MGESSLTPARSSRRGWCPNRRAALSLVLLVAYRRVRLAFGVVLDMALIVIALIRPEWAKDLWG